MLLPAATSTSVQDWLDEQRRQEGDPKHIQAVEALALLLENKASPPETARSITTTYEPTVRAMVARASGSDSYHNKLYSFWALYFCGTVQTFGNIDTHERLIDLLVEISRQPDLLDEDGEPVTGYRDSVYWSDVPDWNRAFVEDGLSVPYIRDFTTRERYLEQIPGFLNATRFGATLLEKQLFTGSFPSEAACALNSGLEHSYDENSRTFAVDADDWLAMVPAAAIWLLVAGKQIYEHCVSGDKSNGWGRGVFTRWKWDLWKQHLGDFTKREDFSEQVREFAAETVEKMSEIEEAHKD